MSIMEQAMQEIYEGSNHAQAQAFEDHIAKQVKEGFIAKDGQPLKCECGCTKFKQVNQTYGGGWIEEYSLECKNEECLKIVGHWSYGNWTV